MITRVTFVLILMWKSSTQNVISTTQGRLRGEVHDGYISYKGIPYASIIKGDGKFKGPGIAPLWQNVRESHEVLCTTRSSAEECLQLDVHVPSASGAHWPVLAWVAGGSGHYHPRTLVQKGIIVVILYHRFGPLGFLCLGDDKIPGNAGVKDVVMALRWIRDNIVAFKGNPAKVIMAGQSFGAAMVEAAMLSPMSNGLYHGVILQSGSVLAPWAFNYDAKERAVKLGHNMFFDDDMSTMFLQTDISELVYESNKIDIPYFPFAMCKENPLKNEERLLSEVPMDLLSRQRAARVPMIIGYNSEESYIFTSILKESKAMKAMRSMTFLLPEELRFLNEREMKQVAKQMDDIYFKTNKTFRAVLKYHRDSYFLCHIHRSARFHALAGNLVYFYQFSYASDLGVLEEFDLAKAGAAHSDELAYLFNEQSLDGDEGAVQTHMVKLWTNFVKYLNPTHKEPTRWDEFDPEHARVLDIGRELRMVEYPHARATAAWGDVYDKYYYSRSKVAL